MSLFPPPDKAGQIAFLAAKGLPYGARMALVAGLLTAGLGVQLAASFWGGLALLSAASLLGLVKGYDAKPKTAGDLKWERVTPDEYAKIKTRAELLKRWDEDCFDISSTRGAMTFAAACALCAGAAFLAADKLGLPRKLPSLVLLDAAVVLAPLWFSGVRDYLRKDKLVIKIGLLEEVMKRLSSHSQAQVFPMLALARTDAGKTAPEDARLLVRLVGAPEAFYGIQVQVSINSVQGKDYPYLYCVLVAKAGQGLLTGWEKLVEEPAAAPAAAFFGLLYRGLGLGGPRFLYEEQSAEGADILLVRQRTGRNSGYATPAPAALALVARALDLAKKLVSVNTQPATMGPAFPGAARHR